MDAYMFRAALYCGYCADQIKHHLADVPEDARDDSEDWPQGPFADGGGEADSPQHCDDCGLFLENPLTSDGVDYVRDALAEGRGDAHTLAEWAEFYYLD